MIHMNRKMLPLCMMLIAGAITVILTFIMEYSMKDRLLALFIVLLIFYFLGSVIQWIMAEFEKQNQEKAMEEGEVIEKEVVPEDTEEEEQNS